MATYILIHGTWHGGWCWKKLTPFLCNAGHTVFTPTLTGLGERSHLLNPNIDLQTHIQDILGVLYYEDLTDVILVGHSYGGMIIAGVANQAAERLAHLVYLDALVPQHGQSVVDVMPASSIDIFRQEAQQHGEGWKLPVRNTNFGVQDEADLAWMRPRFRPHPIKSFEQGVACNNPDILKIPHTFIHCTTGDTRHVFIPFAKAAQSKGWHYAELPTGHDAMITMPAELADILLQLARF